MITVETPVRSLQTQREGLEILLVSAPRLEAQYILGAIDVLNWLEFGQTSPLEELNKVIFKAVEEDIQCLQVPSVASD